MKSFTILHTILSHQQPYNRPSWWTRLKNLWHWIVGIQLYHWNITVAVDTIKRVAIGDIFLGQHGTVWIILNKGVHKEPLYPDFNYIDIKSVKPTAYSTIHGPAVIVVRANGERITDPIKVQR